MTGSDGVADDHGGGESHKTDGGVKTEPSGEGSNTSCVDWALGV